jgi:hypothetical protein
MIRGGAFYGQPKPTLSYPPAEIIVRHCNGPAGASHRSKTMGLIVILVVLILSAISRIDRRQKIDFGHSVR